MNGSVSGAKYIDTLDCDDPEYQREMMRPVDVKEDVRQMEQRRRVQLILNSRAFRDELEDIVVEQQILGSPSTNDPAVSIQRLSEIIIPRFARLSTEDGIGPCMPINDHSNADISVNDVDEVNFRCKVAALHRVFDMHGWAHPAKCSISGRLGQGVERFLVAPFGLPSNEVTASSLVRIDMRGNIIEAPKPHSMQNSAPQHKPLVDKNGFLLHSALYASRPDIRCVAFLSNTQAICISSLKRGLLPVSREAVSIGDVGHFVYNGSSLNMEQRDKLRRIMGNSTKIVSVSNFGVLVAGESVEETYDLARCFFEAADLQLKLVRVGDNDSLMKTMTEEERRSIFYTCQMPQEDREGNVWKRGELRYQALMKQLDNFGYKTGYPYKGGKLVSGSGPANNVSSAPSNNSNMKHEPRTNRGNEELSETINTSKSTSQWAPTVSSTPIKPVSEKEIMHHQSVIDQSFTSKPQVASPSSPQKSVSSTDGEVVSPSKKKKKGFLSFNSKKKKVPTATLR